MNIKENITLDKVDRKILYLLQRDASLTIKQIAARVNLSPTPCWKRIQRLEERRSTGDSQARMRISPGNGPN